MPNTKIPARNSLGILKFLKLEFLFLFRIRIFLVLLFLLRICWLLSFWGLGGFFILGNSKFLGFLLGILVFILGIL